MKLILQQKLKMIEKSEKYWVDLLEQYKLGSISEADRFELEKRALDDPFLFDALEGFSDASQSTASKTKLLTLPRMAAAASLIFLVAMMFLLKNDSAPDTASDQSIAMVLDTSPEESQSSIEEEISPVEKDKNTDNAESTSSSSSNKTAKKPELKSNTKESTDNQIPAIIKETKEESVIGKSNTPTSRVEGFEPDNTAPIAEGMEGAEEIESDDIIVAYAKDEVSIPKNAKKLDSNTQGTQLGIESAGSQEVADNNPITSLQKAKVSKNEEATSTFYKVKPAIGDKDFEEFVKESIDNRGLRQDTPHEVTIEFNIDKDGVLSKFLHIYNGCSECGGYAIYLLSSSGVWKTVPEGQEGRARYTLEF
ncbi:MAG: hypothetical protein ACI86M_002404 [Saprospiraceae bacterium]